MKKFFTGVMNALLVLVPLALLVCGLMLTTGPLWDVLMFAAIVFFAAYAGKKYIDVRQDKDRLEYARNMVALIGVACSFLPLAAQAVFCMLGRGEILPVEGAMTWMFLLMAFGVGSLLKEDVPHSKVLTYGIVLAVCWIIICAIGGIFDIYEYFAEQEIPERLGNFMGILAAISGIGAFVLCALGIFLENRR